MTADREQTKEEFATRIKLRLGLIGAAVPMGLVVALIDMLQR
jgi:hypothetical protein